MNEIRGGRPYFACPPPPTTAFPFRSPPPPFLSTSFSPSFLRPSPPSGRSFESAALLWRNRTPFWRHDPRCINPSTRTTSPFRPRSSSPFFINYNIVDKGSWICWNRGKIRMDIAFVGKRIQISSIYFRGEIRNYSKTGLKSWRKLLRM